jgi:hypothetical protein
MVSILGVLDRFWFYHEGRVHMFVDYILKFNFPCARNGNSAKAGCRRTEAPPAPTILFGFRHGQVDAAR